MNDLDAAPICTSCRSPLWDDELNPRHPACRKCERRGTELLKALPALFRQLNRTSALMKGSSSGQIGGSSTEIPAPLKLGILALTAEGGIVTQLQAIEDSWRKALGWSMGEKRHYSDIDGATRFLTNNLPWACENYTDIADDLRTIISIHGRLKGINAGDPQPRHFDMFCGADGCHGRMSVTMRTDGATCPDCGTRYAREELFDLDSQYGPNVIRQERAA